ASWRKDLLDGLLHRLFFTMGLSSSVQLGPDGRVLAATFVACLVATQLFGLGPALRASRPALVDDLKHHPGAPARASAFFATRHLLVMAQIALSLVLVFSAGLFFQAALRAVRAPLGFEPRGAIVAEVDLALEPGVDVGAAEAPIAPRGS